MLLTSEAETSSQYDGYSRTMVVPTKKELWSKSSRWVLYLQESTKRKSTKPIAIFYPCGTVGTRCLATSRIWSQGHESSLEWLAGSWRNFQSLLTKNRSSVLLETLNKANFYADEDGGVGDVILIYMEKKKIDGDRENPSSHKLKTKTYTPVMHLSCWCDQSNNLVFWVFVDILFLLLYVLVLGWGFVPFCLVFLRIWFWWQLVMIMNWEDAVDFRLFG